MTQEKYESLRLEAQDGVATITFDHPPINLMDATLLADLTAAVQAVSESADIRVLVLQSANEDFFIAHADVNMIQEIPTAEEGGVDVIAAFHETVDQMRTLPIATIASEMVTSISEKPARSRAADRAVRDRGAGRPARLASGPGAAPPAALLLRRTAGSGQP